MFYKPMLVASVCLALEIHAHPTGEEENIWSDPDVVCNMSAGEARRYIRKLAEQSDYTQCIQAAQKQHFWLCMAECEKEGLGKNIGGGCAHLVMSGDNCKLEYSKPEHCELFRRNQAIPLREEIGEAIRSYCIENGYDSERSY